MYNKSVNRFFIILFISILSSGIALGFVCPNIRLDKNFPNNNPVNKANRLSMKNVPVQHQTLGICYSYAATQLIDAQRHHDSPDKEISSPVFTAVNHTSNWSDGGIKLKNGKPNYPFEGGSLCKAYDSAKSVGVCPKADIEKFYTDKGYTEASFFKIIYDAEKRFKINSGQVYKEKNREIRVAAEDTTILNPVSVIRFLGTAYNKSAEADKEVAACASNSMDLLYSDLENIFGTALMPTKEIFKALFDIKLMESPWKFSMFFQWMCPAKKRNTIPKGSVCTDYDVADTFKYNRGESNPFTKKILEKLKLKSLPVGISYCSKVLSRGKSYDGIVTKESSSLKFKQNDKGKNDCGNHASLIIGSKFNKTTKKCDFLIRNTWGTGCSYHKDFKCESGSIWVDHETLEKNTYRVQHL